MKKICKAGLISLVLCLLFVSCAPFMENNGTINFDVTSPAKTATTEVLIDEKLAATASGENWTLAITTSASDHILEMKAKDSEGTIIATFKKDIKVSLGTPMTLKVNASDWTMIDNTPDPNPDPNPNPNPDPNPNPGTDPETKPDKPAVTFDGAVLYRNFMNASYGISTMPSDVLYKNLKTDDYTKFESEVAEAAKNNSEDPENTVVKAKVSLTDDIFNIEISLTQNESTITNTLHQKTDGSWYGENNMGFRISFDKPAYLPIRLIENSIITMISEHDSAKSYVIQLNDRNAISDLLKANGYSETFGGESPVQWSNDLFNAVLNIMQTTQEGNKCSVTMTIIEKEIKYDGQAFVESFMACIEGKGKLLSIPYVNMPETQYATFSNEIKTKMDSTSMNVWTVNTEKSDKGNLLISCQTEPDKNGNNDFINLTQYAEDLSWRAVVYLDGVRQIAYINANSKIPSEVKYAQDAVITSMVIAPGKPGEKGYCQVTFLAGNAEEKDKIVQENTHDEISSYVQDIGEGRYTVYITSRIDSYSGKLMKAISDSMEGIAPAPTDFKYYNLKSEELDLLQLENSYLYECNMDMEVTDKSIRLYYMNIQSMQQFEDGSWLLELHLPEEDKYIYCGYNELTKVIVDEDTPVTLCQFDKNSADYTWSSTYVHAETLEQINRLLEKNGLNRRITQAELDNLEYCAPGKSPSEGKTASIEIRESYWGIYIQKTSGTGYYLDFCPISKENK